MLPGFAGDLRRKRLVRLFELKTWREISDILLDTVGPSFPRAHDGLKRGPPLGP